MADYPRFVPLIDNPYPASFRQVSDFKYLTPLILRREPEALQMKDAAEVLYVVAEDYTVSFKVDGNLRELTVPRGMLTDLASVPRLARAVVGRVGPHLEASIVHDYLFIAWQLLPEHGARYQDFRFANAVMFAGLDQASMSWVERSAIKAALQFPYIAWSVYRSRDDGPTGFGLFVNLDEPWPYGTAIV
jgi:hypothetical protein